MNKAINIAVVYGGISTERDISLKSGEAVYNALIEAGYKNTILFDLHADNVSKLIAMKPDIAYIALHGKGGEDGCIQGALEFAGIAYTGPGVTSSAICMDKIFTKHILKASGIPTADYAVFNKNENSIDYVANTIRNTIGIPIVLKSPCQGSSIGIEIVKNYSDLHNAIEKIYSFGDKLLAEKYITGIEVTLPIIGNNDLVVLPDVEITSEREFYDYKAKYTTGLCHHIIPARISDENRDTMINIGKQVYKIFELCGISRIDYIVNKDEGPIVIEVNTSPGMTEMSLVPDSARAANYSFSELVSRILEYGLMMKRI